MEMTAMRPKEEEETVLRSTMSFKKRNFCDGFNEISTEESKCAKRREVEIAKPQDTLFSLKFLVSESNRFEGWKDLYSAAMTWSSVSQFEKSKSAASMWARAGTMAAKVGKGLSKDKRGQKLALMHWLELIDTHHRYGHNLHFYYNVWIRSHSSQPFFYWLDFGDGKEVNLEQCPRTELQSQCIQYLKPEEREAYEVSIENGRLIYKQNKSVVHTPEGSKWIFVVSTSRTLYVAEKKKGSFHHSSFLAGAATISSGRLVAFNGLLDAIWPYSGHYCPTQKNFMDFIGFLQEQNVDLTNVKKYAIDDDIPPSEPVDEEHQCDCAEGNIKEASQVKERKPLLSSTRAGPRVECVGQYPTKLQFRTLQHLNLSPRVPSVTLGKFARTTPINSIRLTLKLHLSPRLVVHSNLHVSPAN